MKNKNLLSFFGEKITHLKKTDSWALGICILSAIIWVIILTHKYLSFGYGDWDLAFFSQAAWGLIHGTSYVSLFGLNFFGNHSNFIIFPLLPIYALFPSPLTLNIIKVLLFFCGTFVFYLIAKKRIGGREAVILMAAYIFYLPNIFALAWEFDFETLSPLFLFLMYYFYEKENLKGFIATTTITLLIKENMPLILMAFGLLALLTPKKTKTKWGIIPLVIGFLFFYLLTMKIVPGFRGLQTHPYVAHYSAWGKSVGEIILNFFLNPITTFQYLLETRRINFLIEIFLPLLFLPIFSGGVLILALPILLQHLLSSVPEEQRIAYHYLINVSPFLFIATAHTLSKFKKHWKKPFRYGIALILLCSLGNIGSYMKNLKHELALGHNNIAWAKSQMVKAIPNDAGVVATFSFLPQLSGRKYLYSFHKITTDPRSLQQVFPEFSEQISYALLDFSDTWERTRIHPPLFNQRSKYFFFDQDWKMVRGVENILLMQKSHGEPQIPIQISENHFLKTTPKPKLVIDKKFQLIDYEINEEKWNERSLYHITFYWHAPEVLSDNFKMIVSLTRGKIIRIKRERWVGYPIYPTSNWKKGEYVKEDYWFYPGELTRGEYRIWLRFENLSTKTTATLYDKNLKPLSQDIFYLSEIIIH